MSSTLDWIARFNTRVTIAMALQASYGFTCQLQSHFAWREFTPGTPRSAHCTTRPAFKSQWLRRSKPLLSVDSSCAVLDRKNFKVTGLRVYNRRRKMGDMSVSAGASSELYSTKDKDQEERTKGSIVGEDDLLVVGPGVLGSLVGTNWLQRTRGCKVVGQTNTTNRHQELQTLGIVPITKTTHSGDKYPFVIFSAPPSGSDDYVAEVREAAERWNGEGSLLFTASTAIYDVNDNAPCDESSPIVAKGKSPRTDLLLNAEEEALKVGGNVVRFAGLYTRDRGAHTYWLQKGTVDARPDYFLNLIHYEDAADLCVTILKKKTRGKVFMGCDNTPVSRMDIMDALARSGKFDGHFQGFTKTDGPLGKKMNNNGTREKLDWQPKYASFADFLRTL